MPTISKTAQSTPDALLPIIRAGHPTLRMLAETVPDPTAPEVKEIVDQMMAIIDTQGRDKFAGLAAPQVDISKRIFVFCIPDEEKLKQGERPAPEDIVFHVAINPEISPIGDTKNEMWEACFSTPGLAFKLSRANKVHYKYQTLEGKWVEGEASGYLARILQHEYDHLIGHLEIDRLEDTHQFGYLEEVREHLMPQETGAKPRWSSTTKDSPEETESGSAS